MPKHHVSVPPRAFALENTPLPLSRTTWFRWERLGIIPPLLRLGGKTLVQAETIEDLIAGGSPASKLRADKSADAG